MMPSEEDQIEAASGLNEMQLSPLRSRLGPHNLWGSPISTFMIDSAAAAAGAVGSNVPFPASPVIKSPIVHHTYIPSDSMLPSFVNSPCALGGDVSRGGQHLRLSGSLGNSPVNAGISSSSAGLHHHLSNPANFFNSPLSAAAFSHLPSYAVQSPFLQHQQQPLHQQQQQPQHAPAATRSATEDFATANELIRLKESFPGRKCLSFDESDELDVGTQETFFPSSEAAVGCSSSVSATATTPVASNEQRAKSVATSAKVLLSTPLTTASTSSSRSKAVKPPPSSKLKFETPKPPPPAAIVSGAEGGKKRLGSSNNSSNNSSSSSIDNGGKSSSKAQKESALALAHKRGLASSTPSSARILAAAAAAAMRQQESDDSQAPGTCRCRKAKCLKLYCECFAAQRLCDIDCKCNGCENVEENVEGREKAVATALKRNPKAFTSKIANPTPDSAKQHTKGCNCKKSGCLKRYCECYSNGVRCADNCHCDGCLNTEDCESMAKKKPKFVDVAKLELDEDEETEVQPGGSHSAPDPRSNLLPVLNASLAMAGTPNRRRVNTPKKREASLGGSDGLGAQPNPSNPAPPEAMVNWGVNNPPLSHHLTLLCFDFLPEEDLLSLSKVSTGFVNVATSPELWDFPA